MYLYEMGMEAKQVSEATGGVDPIASRASQSRGLDTTKMKGEELISMFKERFGEEMVEVCSR